MGKQPTYQELLAAYKKLLIENELLHKEVDRLQSLLSSKSTPLTRPAIKRHLSLEKKVDVFRNLFKGREDVFARRWYSRTSGKSGYQPVCRNEWDRQLCDKKRYKCTECPNRSFKPLEYEGIYRHLEGKSPDGQDVIGAYAILADNTCNFLCADFDDKSCEHGYQKDVLAYVGVCKDWDVPCSIERSRSGNGAHVLIFFEQPLPAFKARRLGNAILTEATERYRLTLPSLSLFSRMRTGSLILISFLFRPIFFSVLSDSWICYYIVDRSLASATKIIHGGTKTGQKACFYIPN